jgi:hypothetical protein
MLEISSLAGFAGLLSGGSPREGLCGGGVNTAVVKKFKQ